MQNIDTNQIATIYMISDINRELIDTQPPQLPYEADTPHAQQELVDNLKRTAYMYDAYKEILNVSVYWCGTYYHFMYCEDKEPETIRGPYSSIQVCRYEADMLAAFNGLVQQLCPESAGGISIGGSLIAGWKVTSDIWPILVNKMFRNGLRIPQSLMTDPLKRWSTQDRLLDISNIYSQGMSMNMRRLPALADALDYWGCGRPHACPATIRELICTDLPTAALAIENYLQDMNEVIRRYYNVY